MLSRLSKAQTAKTLLKASNTNKNAQLKCLRLAPKTEALASSNPFTVMPVNQSKMALYEQMVVERYSMDQNKAMFMLHHQPHRSFSLFQQPQKNDPKKGGEGYESSFDDLLKGGSVSEQQQKEFEERRHEKAESVKEAQAKVEE